jgi:3-dehydroquinate synthetase
LSRDLFGLSAGDVDRIERLLLQVGLPVRIKLSPASRKKIFTAMKLDKKVSGGEIKFVLAGKIGKVAWGKNVAAEAIARVLEEIQPGAKLSVS